MSYTRGPYAQGRLLDTPMVKRLNEADRKYAELGESKLVLANFSSADDGRSREFIAETRLPEDAERIVACLNACEGITTEALQSGALEIMVDMSLAYVNDDILARNARNGTNCAVLTGQTYFIDKVKVLEEEIL